MALAFGPRERVETRPRARASDAIPSLRANSVDIDLYLSLSLYIYIVE